MPSQLPTREVTNPPGAKGYSDVQRVRHDGTSFYNTLGAAYSARSGPGELLTLTLANNTAAAVVVTLYDNATTAGGSVLGVYVIPAYDTRTFAEHKPYYNGLTFSAAGASVHASGSAANP